MAAINKMGIRDTYPTGLQWELYNQYLWRTSKKGLK